MCSVIHLKWEKNIYVHRQTYKHRNCLSLFEKKSYLSDTNTHMHVYGKRINQSYYFEINASILGVFSFDTSIYRKVIRTIDSSATAFALSFSLPAPARRTYTHMRLFFSFLLLRQGRQQKHTRGIHAYKRSHHIGEEREREKEDSRVGGQLCFAFVTPVYHT